MVDTKAEAELLRLLNSKMKLVQVDMHLLPESLSKGIATASNVLGNLWRKSAPPTLDDYKTIVQKIGDFIDHKIDELFPSGDKQKARDIYVQPFHRALEMLGDQPFERNAFAAHFKGTLERTVEFLSVVIENQEEALVANRIGEKQSGLGALRGLSNALVAMETMPIPSR